MRGDRIGPVAYVHRDGLGDFCSGGSVDVAVPGRYELWAGRQEDFQGGAVVEREGVVDPGFVEPQSDQLVELVGVFGGDVMNFGPVDLRVVELPGVFPEVPPTADRGVGGDGFPAVVVDRPGTEHRVELGVAF